MTSCDTCGMCNYGWQHTILKQNMSNEAWRAYMKAKEEYDRLKSLLTDMTWYHFEVQASKWKRLWHESHATSLVNLTGMRYTMWRPNTGGWREHGEFPVYYNGPVCEAPKLPLEIMLSEVQSAYLLMRSLREAVDAPFEWAPGGVKYQELYRTTTVPKRYDLRQFSRETASDV